MFSKFFNLKVVDRHSGQIHKATWPERFSWLVRGRPLKDEKVVARFVQLKHRHAILNHDVMPSQLSNTQVG